jgi:hypothetical protein
MWLFSICHSERSEESSTKLHKNWILRQDKTLTQNDGTSLAFAYFVLFTLFLLPQVAFALSSITITAETIEHDKGGAANATLHNTRAVFDLNRSNTIALKSERITHDDAELKGADIVVDLAAKTTYTIKAEHIQYQNFEARNANIFLDMRKLNNQNAKSLTFDTDLKQNTDKAWAKAQMHCLLPNNLATETWDCSDGKFTAERINLPFSLSVLPQAKGFIANIKLQNANFSDEAGLHAAEKLTGHLTLVAKQDGDTLRFNSALNWQSGEMFWQPLYIANGGHELQMQGNLKGDVLTLDNATLKLDKVGDLIFSGKINTKNYTLYKLDADLPSLNLTEAYPLLFKPFLGKTLLNNADIDGKAAMNVSVIDSQIKAFKVTLKDVNIDDKNKKFAFYNINADIPWSYDDATQVRFSYNNGTLLNMPLGRTNIGAEVNRYSLVALEITLPILDGALKLGDISAARINDNWYWHLRAALTPVSMPDASRAFKLPIMQGKASAEIPLVTYSGGILTTDGAITLNVFDGTATVTQLTLQNPLSESPKLSADMNLRNLDMGALTRTFSFGAIEGKLDGDVQDLEMLNWKPVKMDASLHSSPGNYLKKISQRAVENISSLGGAGAAAAVQRSVLRFFKEFNYEKLGLSCTLRDNICEMNGIESTPGGYVIVKGSGIPAITVLGYNKTVGWGELVDRVKHVIDGNTKLIVK